MGVSERIVPPEDRRRPGPLLDAPPCVTNDVAAVRSPMIVGRAHGVIRLLPKCDQYVQTLPRR